MIPTRPRFYLLTLTLLLPLLAACGVSFSQSFDGTELFKAIDLTGDRSVGSELTVTVMVTQTYPVPVEVACFYEDGNKLTDDDYRVAFQERAQRVGQTVLPAAPEDRKQAKKLTKVPISFKFSVTEPGDYFLACMTPAAADNGLGVYFTIQDSSSSGRSSP